MCFSCILRQFFELLCGNFYNLCSNELLACFRLWILHDDEPSLCRLSLIDEYILDLEAIFEGSKAPFTVEGFYGSTLTTNFELLPYDILPTVS